MIDQGTVIAIMAVLGVALVAVVICLSVLLYHQMLLFNELNKRLLVKSIDDQEKYEGAMAELADAEARLQNAADSILAPKGPLDDADEDEIHDLDLDN